jgi:hypothetical protein
MSITERLKANQAERDEIVNEWIDFSYDQGCRAALMDIRAAIEKNSNADYLLEYINKELEACK